ncbi:MAG: hypothetical protein J6J31_02910 [Thermoguttaceae bacterium]|nr:hypothetical protein [Thermoguttaceae bacterium]
MQTAPRSNTLPMQTAPRANAAPTQTAPRANAAPTQTAPRANAAPMQTAPRANPAPTQTAPRSNTLPMQTAPRANAAPTQTAPRANAAPTQTAPRANAAPMQTAPRANAAPMQTAPRANAAPTQTAPRADPAPIQSVPAPNAAQAPKEPQTLSGFTAALNEETHNALKRGELVFRNTQNMTIQNIQLTIRAGLSRIEGRGTYRREKKQVGSQELFLAYWETNFFVNPEDSPSIRNQFMIQEVCILNEELQKYWLDCHKYMRITQGQEELARLSELGQMTTFPNGLSVETIRKNMEQEPNRPQVVTLEHLRQMTDLGEVHRRIQKHPERYSTPKPHSCRELPENLLKQIQDSFYFVHKNGDSFQDGVSGFMKPELAYSIMQNRGIHVPDEIFRLVGEKQMKKEKLAEDGTESEKEVVVWRDLSHISEEDFQTFLNHLPKEIPTQAEVFFRKDFLPLRICFRRTDYDPKDKHSGFLIDIDLQPSEIFLDNIKYGPNDFIPGHSNFEDNTENVLESLRKAPNPSPAKQEEDANTKPKEDADTKPEGKDLPPNGTGTPATQGR